MLNLYKKIFGEKSNGILEIDSGKKGKTFVIVACTHGNEPAGLYTIDFLLNNFNLKQKLKKGKIIFVLGNIEAMKKNKRFIDFDFNRIWGFEEKYKNSYEYKRALEIKSILEKADILLDIHSTTLESDPFGIFISKGINLDILDYLDLDYSIDKIADFLNGKLLSKYMADYKKGNFSFAIETGSHNSKKTIDLAIKNTLIFLKYFGFINGTLEKKVEKLKNYIVKKCIYAESMNIKFLYSKNPKSFDTINKNQKILLNGKKEIISDDNYILLMPSYPKYILEEILYLMK